MTESLPTLSATTIAEEPRREKYMYAQQLVMGSGRDLCSWERDGIGIELRRIGMGAGQLVVGTGGSGTGKLVRATLKISPNSPRM